MQKKYIPIIALALLGVTAKAQDNVYPALPQNGKTVITHATLHLGNGTTLTDASIAFEKGKITQIGNIVLPTDASKIIDGTGKHVYPGLILPSSDLGLREISSGVRGSNDYAELGENNANIRSIVAYNTDSKMLGVLRENGILLAGVAPQGELIEGSSSVVQLDAWNYEDAVYKWDNGIYINMPSFMPRRGRMAFMRPQGAGDPVKAAFEKIETIKTFFTEAKAYFQEKTPAANNLKFEAVRGLFDGRQKLFVRANEVKQILLAIELAKSYGLKLVIVGGSEAFQIAAVLAENNVAVILDAQHSLPAMEDDDVDQPYKTPAALEKAGVLYCLNDTHDQSRYRNLAFNAGTAATYGLTKEQALSAITINSAKILGIDNTTGSLEIGKDANILITTGDLLDMKTSVVNKAFIQGRDVSLDNKGKQLYERYKFKYGIH